MKIVRRRGSRGEQTSVPCSTIGQLRIWWYQEPQKVGDATEVWKQNWLKVHTWSIGPLPRQYCGDSECLLMAGRRGRQGYLPGPEAFMFVLFLKYSEGPLHWGSGSGLMSTLPIMSSQREVREEEELPSPKQLLREYPALWVQFSLHSDPKIED